METQVALNIWAKKSEENDQHYPLLCHMLDATAVCLGIWEKCLHHGARQSIASALQLTESDASQWISLWVGLHDIGKASPDFQGKSETAKEKLKQAGFKFNRRPDTYHGIASACILQGFLENKIGIELAKKISVTVGGHHGRFPQAEELQRARPFLGEGLWKDTQTKLYMLMVELCNMQDIPVPKGSPGNAFFMVLAGLTSVADWVASNEVFFPYKVQHDIEAHPDYARSKAMEALDKLAWTGWQPAPSPVDTVKQLFPFISDIRPLQQEVKNLAETCSHQPGLVIIEAPMGEGKTEAAIYLADSWVANLKQKGYYFALPTMATSDQMFGRVEQYLEKRYPNDRVNFMLLHGHAALSTEFNTLKEKFNAKNVDADSEKPAYDGVSAGIVASEWFTYRKHGLLSPFGVGTIDQALLAVLQTRHFFVRLFGLAHKTVIIDEVHAYDAYMSTLLERLLEWLAALGSSVVLLSATLPKERKNALLYAYQKGVAQQGDLPEVVDGASYPRISWSTGNAVRAKTIETSRDSKRSLRLQWIDGKILDGTEFILGKRLQERLEHGGCAAIICNTVDRAQRIYGSLKKYFPGQDAGDGSPELYLLHARYLYGDRKAREERTLLQFGKPGAKVKCGDGKEREVKRPRHAILVATQIIEQSLDLDFDLMVTEMAPVDLLLQRAGRLHRHNRNRPEGLEEPVLWICEPEIKDGVPAFGGGTEAVYDYHILLRSWLAIGRYAGKKPALVPEDVESLIEKVYGERLCPEELSEKVKNRWEESWEELKKKRNVYESKAKINRILPPRYEDEILEDFNRELEEDNPEIHDTLQALTRLSESPSISIICLYGDMDKPRLDIASQALDTQTIDIQTVKALLNRSTQLSHKTIVRSAIESNSLVPQAWRKEALLRHHYLLFFDESGKCKSEFPKYGLWLDDSLGIVITEKEE